MTTYQQRNRVKEEYSPMNLYVISVKSTKWKHIMLSRVHIAFHFQKKKNTESREMKMKSDSVLCIVMMLMLVFVKAQSSCYCHVECARGSHEEKRYFDAGGGNTQCNCICVPDTDHSPPPEHKPPPANPPPSHKNPPTPPDAPQKPKNPPPAVPQNPKNPPPAAPQNPKKPPPADKCKCAPQKPPSVDPGSPSQPIPPSTQPPPSGNHNYFMVNYDTCMAANLNLGPCMRMIYEDNYLLFDCCSVFVESEACYMFQRRFMLSDFVNGKCNTYLGIP
ncbi:sulfated surface glycoprotein 185-like [Mercurialis annua]|uniref:sulfated surface glycoprotein 185-like n=1 Tax=Mercurialis annua TaxID=3986 RepID=UPI0024B00025|nr:sulfated surface glycoprotein 185-like [Mercurialis annua]